MEPYLGIYERRRAGLAEPEEVRRDPHEYEYGDDPDLDDELDARQVVDDLDADWSDDDGDE